LNAHYHRHVVAGGLRLRADAEPPTRPCKAQNVMMAKWGLRQQDQAPQADAEGDFDKYMAVFGEPLSESKREAIRRLFPAGCAIEGIQLVEGDDLEV